MDDFDPCNIWLAIATNIPVLLKTGLWSNYIYLAVYTRLVCFTFYFFIKFFDFDQRTAHRSTR